MSWRLDLDALEARGQATAVEGCRPPLSYQALATRGRHVAEALREAGVRPGDPVGVLSKGRAHDEPVALAGVLGLGAVAVPLDAASPRPRLDAILTASGCRAVVSDAPVEGASPVAQLDADGALLSLDGAVSPSPREPTADLAAILHTSGSTGVPKPVPIRWEGLDAFTAWMSELTGLAPTDRVLRCAELLFDLAWFDHLATWRAGATLLTMTRRELASGRSIAQGVERLRPDVIYGVPGLFVSALTALEGPWPAPTRAICFAGEVFPPAELKRLAEASDARLYNLFGPTETNVCTYWEVDRAALDGASPIPIGVAPPYCETWRVDEEGHRVEGPGEGELVVAGPTALGGTFATRDRVHWDGEVYWFRGRIDRMVKIRGFRVEPGEVEAALMRHEAVREAAVTPVAHPRFGRVLVGHVTVRDEVSAKTLRKHVARLLAAYMVPDSIVIHDHLPRTATGKIDLTALLERPSG